MLRNHISASQMLRIFAKWLVDGQFRSFFKALKKAVSDGAIWL